MKKATIEILYSDRSYLFEALSGLWEALQCREDDKLDWTSDDEYGIIEYQRKVTIQDVTPVENDRD